MTGELINITNKSQEVSPFPVGDHKAAMDRSESMRNARHKLEELTVLKRSPDLLNNVKIGQDQLRLIMKHTLFYGGYGHFGQVT